MKKIVSFLVPLFLLVGCAKEPTPVVVEAEPVVVLDKFAFSTKMINKYSLSSVDICSLQFYISHDIELKRKIPASSSTITNGTLVINKNDKILSILIKKGTPAVATKAEENYIVVKFSEDIELTFMHSAKKKDLFLLTANKWSKGKGNLMLNGSEYQATGKSGLSHLLMNKTDVDNSNINATIVEGSLLY